MKFVVTGGLGFIGSYIVKHLLSKDHQVTVVDNFWRGRLENLTGFEEKINFQKLDILDFDALKEILNDSDGRPFVKVNKLSLNIEIEITNEKLTN